MRVSLAFALTLSLIACASSRPAQTVKDSKDPAGTPTLSSNAGGPNAKGKYSCQYEEETGSHQRQKVCRYVDDQSDGRQRVQDTIRHLESESPRRGN